MTSNRIGKDYLQRLPPEYSRGLACVIWTMTIQDRKTGWLSPLFHARFRELLTHAMFRYGLCCPIYCLMPDHMHLLWLGLMQESNQRLAMRFFRKALNPVLKAANCRFQDQPYDHVLRKDERQPAAFKTSLSTSRGIRNGRSWFLWMVFVSTNSPDVWCLVIPI